MKKSVHRDEQRVMETYEQLATRILNKGYRHNPLYLARKAAVDWELMSSVDLAGSKVLNVGCFEPIDELQWAAAVKEWIAIDLSPKSIQVAKKIIKSALAPALQKRVRFQVMDASDLVFKDGTFDLAVSFSVLDHVPDPETRSNAIREMARVVRPGGHVIITVPNRRGYYRFMYQRNTRRGVATDVGYQYFYTREELKQSLRDAGLQPLRFTSDFKNINDLPKVVRAVLLPFLPFGDRMGYLAKKP